MVLERSSERYVVLPESALSGTRPSFGVRPVSDPLIGNIFIGAGDQEGRLHGDEANASVETSEGVLTASGVAPPPGRRHVAKVAAHRLHNADSSAHLGRYAIALADSCTVRFAMHSTLDRRVRHESRSSVRETLVPTACRTKFSLGSGPVAPPPQLPGPTSHALPPQFIWRRSAPEARSLPRGTASPTPALKGRVTATRTPLDRR